MTAERTDPALDPGWWVCPICERTGDRAGARGTARRFCVGGPGTGAPAHRLVEMEVRR